MRFSTLVVLCCLTACAQQLLADEGDSKRTKLLTPAEFKLLHKELQPGDEPWRTIPWKIALLDAQRTAAKSKKPIFIWAMDGHPLGCT
jgi:diphthamide synthase subunit DPH2